MLLAGVAAFGLVACSSDELENGGVVDPGTVGGDVAYMNINIKDANAMSRSTTSDEGVNGFEFGSEKYESFVKTAHFYFFTEGGAYANIKASVWSDGGMNPNEPNNIEHFGNNVIVLTGLTTTSYPKYMITVINQPANFDQQIEAAGTLAGVSKLLTQWKNADENFVMTSTSYYNEGQTIKNHNDTYYYANELEAKNFIRTNSNTPVKPGEINPNDNAVDVYVERLAVKVQVGINRDKTDGSQLVPVEGKDNLYELPLTVAGDGNTEEGDNGNGNDGDNTADSKLYISFEGWGLNAVANNSYLSKQLTNWNALTFTWNVPSFRRSYWGMGEAYGKDIVLPTALKGDGTTTVEKQEGQYLTYYSWNGLKNTLGFTKAEGSDAIIAQYCNEYTNVPGKIINTEKVMDNGAEVNAKRVEPGKTTSVLLKANICDVDGNPLDMVLHNGVLYKENAYLTLVINAVKTTANVSKYYYENGTNPDGSVKYTQLEAEKMLALVKTDATGEGEAKIKVVVADNADFTKLPTLYTVSTNDKGETVVTEMTNVAGDFANDLVAAQTNWVAQEFKDGKMYYNIPIEHLAASETAKAEVDVEGYYGVVRNHWYKLKVNSIKRLGHPVFNENEVIIPKVEDPTYYLGAQINILSWKVVNQNVDLD